MIHELSAILLAPRRLRWTAHIVFILKEFGEQASVHFALDRHGAAGVAAELSAGEARGQLIHHHVARTGVESDYAICRTSGGQDGHIGDAADVQGHSAHLFRSEQKIVNEGDQRRALAPGGHVAWPEVVDNRDLSSFGQDRPVADLQRRSHLPAQVIGRLGLVEDRLAVAADQLDRLRIDAGDLAGFEERFGVDFGQQEIEPGDLARMGGAVAHSEQRGANLLRIGDGMETGGIETVVVDIDQGDIDPVERCPAHDARDSHCRFNSSFSSFNSCSASIGFRLSISSVRMRSAI